MAMISVDEVAHRLCQGSRFSIRRCRRIVRRAKSAMGYRWWQRRILDADAEALLRVPHRAWVSRKKELAEAHLNVHRVSIYRAQ